MSQIRVNFLNWRPDMEPSSHDGLTEAENVYHDTEGYKQITKNTDSSASVLSLVASNASLTSTQIRQIGPRMTTDNLNSKMLARLTSATLASLKVCHSHEESNEDITATLTASAGTAVAMASAGAILSFGVCELAGYVFAAASAVGKTASGMALRANVTGTMAISTIDASTGHDRGGEYFSNTLTSVTASALTCATINQFVVIADYDDNTSVRWCAIGNPNSWPTPNTDAARAVQAGSQSMPPHLGVVTAIAPGDFFGYVFQQRGITKMTYVGGDVVFAFDLLEQGRGCLDYNRLAIADGVIFFESEDGYHALRDGQITDIGYGRVNDVYTPAVVSTQEQQNVVANEAINCVFFENQTLCYNYKTDQWTRIPAYDGYPLYSIFDQDAIIGTVVITHAVNDTDAIQGQAGGTAQTATLETAESDLNPGGRMFVSGVRPLLNKSTATSVTVSIGERDDLSEAVTYHTLSSVNSRTGRHDGRVDGRYLRTRVVITGGFDTVIGEDIDGTPSGSV